MSQTIPPTPLLAQPSIEYSLAEDKDATWAALSSNIDLTSLSNSTGETSVDMMAQTVNMIIVENTDGSVGKLLTSMRDIKWNITLTLIDNLVYEFKGCKLAQFTFNVEGLSSTVNYHIEFKFDSAKTK